MTLIDALRLFSILDAVAVGVLLVSWLGSTLLVENAPARFPSVSQIMAGYRRDWMRQFVARDPRIFDAQIVGNLRQSTAFFASASLIAIGGGFALLGNADRLRGVAQDFIDEATPLVLWEIKVFLLLLFALNAFLKFVWSNRLFGYCSIIMGAVPNDPADPKAIPVALKAAAISNSAARGYNRGLRAVYFGIAASGWLLGPHALIVATLFTLAVVLRREFGSQSRQVLMSDS